MFAVAFDTLKLARILESTGVPSQQAQDFSAALSESLSEWLSAGNIEQGRVRDFRAGMNFMISATEKLAMPPLRPATPA